MTKTLDWKSWGTVPDFGQAISHIYEIEELV